MTLEELEAEVLKLNPNSRSRLAETLLHSLEGLSDAEIERFWADEALRRDVELESGKASSKPAEEVLRDARSQVP